ncbi:MAG: M28 family metallopeptidase, partial [Blastocatellia bacterium]
MMKTAQLLVLLFSVLCIAQLSQPSIAQSSRIEAITRRLVSPEFNGRAFKTDSGRKAAEYIAAQFREAGLKPIRAEYLQPIAGGGQNVAGILEGQRNDEFILIAAHYDAFGGPFAGARDSAAAVAVMIEMARLAAKAMPQRSLLFLALDGEEQRQAGLKFYLDQPLAPIEKTAAAIKLHNFGGGMGEKQMDRLYVSGAEFSPQLREVASKFRNDAAHLALLGGDVMRWPGNDHGQFGLEQVPALSVTNGVHYSFHSRHDTTHRIAFAALDKHAATLVKLILGIANQPKIERQADPAYDAEESLEWQRLLTALREQVLKKPENDAGQSQIDDALLELKRLQGRAVQDPRAREAVILRAANIAFFMANPSAADYNALETAARNAARTQHRTHARREQLRFHRGETNSSDRRDEPAIPHGVLQRVQPSSIRQREHQPLFPGDG